MYSHNREIIYDFDQFSNRLVLALIIVYSVMSLCPVLTFAFSNNGVLLKTIDPTIPAIVL